MNHHVRRLGGAAASVGLALLVGCSNGSPTPKAAPSTLPSVVASIAVPPPDQRGPDVTVEGQVIWTTEHPGCPELQTSSGQRFHLTGELASKYEQRAAIGEEPRTQRVRITGYVPHLGASVCSARFAFVAQKVTTVDR
jgi:hypothetical protein